MRLLLLMIFLSAALSCRNSGELPAGVLAQPKMQEVMWDMIQADEFLKDYVFKDSTVNDTLESIRMYERVFMLHGTDRKTFDSSYNYYRTHPVKMKEILDSLYEKSRQIAPTSIYQGDTSRKLPIDTGNLQRVRKMIRQE
jgi:hypothetical protein